MSMPSGKIATYIGFARRARKVKVGVNAISTVKGQIPLMLVCATASENTLNEAISLAKKHGAKLVLTKQITVADFFGKENARLAAILDKNLSNAILENLTEEYEIIGG